MALSRHFDRARTMKWKINTSNWGKFQEYQELFAKYKNPLEATHIDLPEIHADPLKVIVHKASQMEDQILVDDTSLDIEGADVGVNVRWFIDNLHNFVGRPAVFRVYLAYRSSDKVYVYAGEIKGKIVDPSGAEQKGFGFDKYFLPDGEYETLAQAKPERVNARAIAVKNLFGGKVHHIGPVVEKWDGLWQQLGED